MNRTRINDLITRWSVTATYLLFCGCIVIAVLLLERR